MDDIIQVLYNYITFIFICSKRYKNVTTTHKKFYTLLYFINPFNTVREVLISHGGPRLYSNPYDIMSLYRIL